MPEQLSVENITLTAAGGTITLPVNEGTNAYNLIADGGAITLTNNLTINVSGTPVEGMVYKFNSDGNVTLGGNVYSILGLNFDAQGALAGFVMEFTYTSGTWEYKYYFTINSGGNPTIDGQHIQDGTMLDAKFPANELSVSKIKDTSQGYAIRGGAAGVLEYFDAKTANAFLMGDGTDLTSQILSGDITVSAGGVTAIGAGKVTPAMLSNTPQEYFLADLTIATGDIFTLNATPITIAAAPGSGFFIEVISATTQMTFAAAAYTTNTTVQLINTGATVAQLEDSAILLSTVDKITKFEPVTAATAGQTQIIENTALQVKVATGNPAAGDSDIKIQVIYAIKAI
jgi:hypothetical protein